MLSPSIWEWWQRCKQHCRGRALTLRCCRFTYQKWISQEKQSHFFSQLNTKRFHKNRQIYSFYFICLPCILRGICACLCCMMGLRFVQSLFTDVRHHRSTLPGTQVNDVQTWREIWSDHLLTPRVINADACVEMAVERANTASFRDSGSRIMSQESRGEM